MEQHWAFKRADRGNPDDVPTTETCCPPTVPVPLGSNMVDLVIVTSNEDTLVIVGLWFLVDEWVVVMWKLEVALKLGTILSRDLVFSATKFWVMSPTMASR